MGLGVLGWISGGEMYVRWVPAAPEHVAKVLFWSGLFGALASALACTGARWKSFPMLLWYLGLTGVLVSTLFRSEFRFDGTQDLANHGWMLLAALVLVVMALIRFRARVGKRVRYGFRTTRR